MSVNVDLQFLTRTLHIRYGKSLGASFCIQLNGAFLIVTAAHLVEGLCAGDAIAVRHRNSWVFVEIAGISKGAHGSDVCVLMPATKWGDGLEETQLDAAILQGQDVVYCGFPLGMSIENFADSNGFPMPFVKSAIFSGAIQRKGFLEYVFDTLNNQGFSGGPIVKRDHSDRKLKVAAVVSGYKFDAPIPILQKLPDGTSAEVADYWVRPNSGFMIGVPVHLAIAAAKELCGSLAGAPSRLTECCGNSSQ